jgi:hypothetical protein
LGKGRAKTTNLDGIEVSFGGSDAHGRVASSIGGVHVDPGQRQDLHHLSTATRCREVDWPRALVSHSTTICSIRWDGARRNAVEHVEAHTGSLDTQELLQYSVETTRTAPPGVPHVNEGDETTTDDQQQW